MPRCAICKDKFTPHFSSFQKVCEKEECRVEFALKAGLKERERLAKERKKKDREVLGAMKERSMTLSDWLQLCQKVVNTYVRLRDREMNCVSCSRKLDTKYDCGHYFSRGSYPNLRFLEDNLAGQCVKCNRDLHGNLIEFREGLIKRIGMDRFELLETMKHVPRKYTVPEVQELIKYYKQKIKELSR